MKNETPSEARYLAPGAKAKTPRAEKSPEC